MATATKNEIDLEEYTVAELRDLAADEGIQVHSNATKAELIKAITKAHGGDEKAEISPLAYTPTGPINTLPLADVVSDLYGIGKKYNIALSDITGLGAVTQGNLLIDTLPAGSVIQYVRIKHTTSVAGPSISACTAQVATSNVAYGAAFDVFQAVSSTAFATVVTPSVASPFQILGVASPPVENFATTTPLYLVLIATGANLGVATAGAISVWVRYYLIA